MKGKNTTIKSKKIKNEIHSLDIASEKGASRWLKAMPLKQYHFDLTKTKFRDDIAFAMVETVKTVKMPLSCA